MKLVIGMVLLLLAGVLYVKFGQAGGKGRTPKVRSGSLKRAQDGAPAAVPPHRATSIVPGKTACAAAQQLQGKLFLDADGVTPMLPLEGCDAGSCDCRYAHHHDRRESDGDRREAGNLQAQLYEIDGGSEQRKSRGGRRRHDLT